MWKGRQERKGRKKEERRDNEEKFITFSWYNFAEGNEHIIFVSFEKAFVKIVINKNHL